MKNLFIKLISLVLALTTIFTLTACGDTHKHAFDQQNTSADYLVSEATCTAPAKYYYSCACGEKGTATYDVGSAKHDYIDHVCKFCQKQEVYTQGIRYAVLKTGGVTILGLEEGVTADPVIIPQKFENQPVINIGQSAFEGATFKQIVLPDGVQTIFKHAFKDAAITSITFPASLKQIYPYAFEGSKLGTATFTVTTGWYVTRNTATTKPTAGSLREESGFKPATAAKALTYCDTSNQGAPKPGASFWTRFE